MSIYAGLGKGANRQRLERQTLTRRWRQIQGSSDGTGVGDAERNEEKKRDGEREVDIHRDRETNSERKRHRKTEKQKEIENHKETKKTHMQSTIYASTKP